MKIATNSICKNEIRYLNDWYDALKNEVDYITVLDTGSTDGTWEALQELSKKDPKVIISQKEIKPWRFDIARNEAMNLLPADADIWISIDLDERFEPGFSKILKENWKTGYTIQALYRYTWNHHPDGSPNHEFTYSKILINDKKWIWQYPLHECLKRTENTVGNKTEVTGLTASDVASASHGAAYLYTHFLSSNLSKNDALPYDSYLTKSYHYKNIGELSSTEPEGLVKRHFGEWPLYETLVVNE